MKKEVTKTAIHEQRFTITLNMGGINAEQAARAIGGYLPDCVFEEASNEAKAITDHLGRTWGVAPVEGASGEASVCLTTPELAYEDMDDLLCLVGELKASGARGGEGCGMSLIAAMGDQPARAAVNLRNSIASKSVLLEKVLGCAYGVEEEAESQTSPAVEVLPCGAASSLDEDEMRACIQLACAMSAQAINQNRVSAEVLRPENEKYAFRCWLNRMGLKSEEYKPMRMRFLKRLKGDASYKDGRASHPAS